MRDALEHITDLEAVRQRAGMYFDLESPLVANCLARESYCLAIDQILAKTCSNVTSVFTADGFLSVSHNGASLEIEQGTGFGGFPEMLFVAERLGFCADRAASEYVHTHVCKNGITTLNACSERFELHNFHNRSHYLLAYQRGSRENGLQDLGPCSLRGVTVRFKPDVTIVRSGGFDVGELQAWFASLPIDVSRTEIGWLDQRGAHAG